MAKRAVFVVVLVVVTNDSLALEVCGVFHEKALHKLLLLLAMASSQHGRAEERR